MTRITSALTFGEAIRARRKELHYTQGFLSEFSGLSVSFISDLENGKKTVEYVWRRVLCVGQEHFKKIYLIFVKKTIMRKNEKPEREESK